MLWFKHKTASEPAAGRKEKTIGDYLLSQLVRYGYGLTIIIIILVLVWLMYFLYCNVYQTLGQAEIVTQLKQKVLEEDLQQDKFNLVVEKLKAKQQAATSTPPLTGNPFKK